jgi:O-antigen/teichoic acid export membrane protein
MRGGAVVLSDDLSRVTEDSARGGFFLFSGSALATVIMAVAAIVVGRLLGPDLYGQYNLVITVPALVLLFTDLGIGTGITKFAASVRNEGNDSRAFRIIRCGVWFRFLVGIVATVLSVVFSGYLALVVNRPDFAFYVQIVSLSIVFQVVFVSVNSAFVGLDKSEYNAFTTNVQAIAKTVLQVSIVLFSFSLSGVLIGYVGGFAIASIVGAFVLFHKLLRPARGSGHARTDPNNETYGQILNVMARYGMPLYVSTLLVGFIPLYQKVVLGFFSSNVDVGSYSASTNFVSLLSVIPISITTALLPAFSKLDFSSTPELVNAFFKRANKYTCLLIVPTATLLLLFSNQVIEIVYGSAYSSAGLFLAFSVLVYFLAAIGSLSLTSLFNGLGKTRLTLRVALVNILVVIGLSPILAHAYGVVGAVLAYLIGGIFANSYAAYIGVHRLKVQFEVGPTVKIYLAGFLASLLPLLLLHFIWTRYVEVLIIGAVLYLIVYVTLMALINIVDERELAALERMTSKIRGLRTAAKPVVKYMRRIHSMRPGSKQTAKQ